MGYKFLGTSIILILLTLPVWAQEQPIDIVVDQSQDSLTLWGINHTDLTQEVTLQLVVENLLGYDDAITLLIPPKDSLVMTKLGIPKGKHWKWSSDYAWKPKPTEQELLVYNIKKKQEVFKAFEVDENPLILFYKEGCSRSRFAKESLERKKISFKLINTTSNVQDGKRLSELIRIEDPDNKQYLFPVFLDRKQLVYDITDLRGYMKSLVKNYK
ncbi:hypothetical protein ACOKFD_04980 [Flagellimonas sp. S174]|uniref:hypothetical protein n=1 Tax=Flagellimonas sp. S174 TaxID=3410790 RepID=UPI003BF49374